MCMGGWGWGVGAPLAFAYDFERHTLPGRGKGRKEMFYLTMHSTHFYLRLYGVGGRRKGRKYFI